MVRRKTTSPGVVAGDLHHEDATPRKVVAPKQDDGAWKAMFDSLKRYREEHGHCHADRDASDTTLGQWGKSLHRSPTMIVHQSLAIFLFRRDTFWGCYVVECCVVNAMKLGFLLRITRNDKLSPLSNLPIVCLFVVSLESITSHVPASPLRCLCSCQ